MSRGNRQRCSHHDAGLTIILPRRGFDDDPWFGSGLLQAMNESADALISGLEAVLIDQFLPDRHRVPAT